MADQPIRDANFPDLAGASVFITGGGAGIGAALTEAFLQQGARVAFVQRTDNLDVLGAQSTRIQLQSVEESNKEPSHNFQ